MHRILTRVAEALLLLWLVTTMTFTLLHLAPGDPATLLLPPGASAGDAARLRTSLGLDASIAKQYVLWLGGVLKGDMGTSIALSQPVSQVIREALPVSLFLGGTSLALSYLFGILAGIFQSRRSGTLTDASFSAASTVVYAAPSFWLALALITAATSGASFIGAPMWLRFPAFGMRDPASLEAGWSAVPDILRHAILPLVVLAIPGAAGVARYARQALVDARALPHVRAARARGLSEARLEMRHVLRNALPPLVVLFGLMLPGVVAGSVFVEQIFAWPGLGRAMISAISARDYPVVLGMTIVYASAVILANLTADLIVLRLDAKRLSR